MKLRVKEQMTVTEKAIKKGDTAQENRIKRNNLGKKKWDAREARFKGQIKTLVFTATQALMQNAVQVAYEDLTEQISSKKPMKKRIKRNVSSWCKGVVADALKQVSTRVGCTVVSVNCAYTSQLDSRFGTLTGTRAGDKFIAHDGVVLHSDTNAAENILVRMGDVEIPRYLKHEKAKIILLEKTQKFLDSLNPVKGEILKEAIRDTDKSQTLEPKKCKALTVNQGVNTKQLTLFDCG